MQKTTQSGGTAVVYVRTASYALPPDSGAVDHQRRVCAQARHLGVTIAETYVDNGVSGLSESRPALDRMLADLSHGRIGYVITSDLARLARNSELASKLTDKISRFGARLVIAKK